MTACIYLKMTSFLNSFNVHVTMYNIVHFVGGAVNVCLGGWPRQTKLYIHYVGTRPWLNIDQGVGSFYS